MPSYGDPEEAEVANLLEAMPPVVLGEVAKRRIYARVCSRRLAGPRSAWARVLAAIALVGGVILCAPMVLRWLIGIIGKLLE